MIQNSDAQYAVHSGKMVDMDIEHVMALVTDLDYTDPLLNEVFWQILFTYFKEELQQNPERKRATVRELIEDPEAVRTLLYEWRVHFTTIPVSSKHFTKDLLNWMPGAQFCARVDCILGMTKPTPGTTRSHALVMAMLQRARELSSANLNRDNGQNVH